MKYKFFQIVNKEDGFLRGPFGSALKKSLFVPKSDDAYKVYEQCVPLEQNQNLGKYYISKEYFESSLSKFDVREGDFLVSCSGVNYGAIIELKAPVEKGVINQALLRIRLNDRIVDHNYFLYLFKGLIYKKITMGTGDSTVPNFPPMNVVKNIDFDLPDLQTQKKIGQILFNLDEKVRTNTKTIDILERYAEDFFKRWFLQFDFIGSDGKLFFSSKGEMLIDHSTKLKCPIGWKVINIKELCNLTWGQCPNGENILPLEYDGIDAMLYCSGAGDMRDGLVVDCQAKTNLSKRTANEGDILMSVAGSIGALVICDKKISLGRAAVAFTPKRKNHTAFCYFILKTYTDRIKQVSSGSIQKVINDNHIDEINFAYNESVVDRFGFANTILDRCVSLIKENKQLLRAKEDLLRLLMSGQATIK